MLNGRQPATRYLPVILELEEAGVVPIRARLCERFGASHPTVSGNVGRLVRSGYLRAGDDGALVLTNDGRDLAATLLGNLRMAQRFLAALGIDDATVRQDAEHWALVMSEEVAEALADLVHGDAPCPFDHAGAPSGARDPHAESRAGASATRGVVARAMRAR